MQTWLKILFILLVVSIITSEYALAQEPPVIKDSTSVYRNIETFSVRRKFTKFMYQLLFKPVAVSPGKKDAKKKVYKKLIQKPYSAFEGKIIRKISIVTLDPFGYSIADTIVRPPTFISKNGNALHVKSKQIAIRNLLLIRKNQVFDSLLVKESERLVRSQGYITDVSFIVLATPKTSDSVDVYIRELDSWSIIPGGAASATGVKVNLRDNNFMGLGHESVNEIGWNRTNGDYGYKVNYYVPNIRNTYINSTLHFGREESGDFDRSFAIDRPFFSPFAKWAAGVSFTQYFRQNYIHATDSLQTSQRVKFNIHDYWVGNSIRLFKGNTEYRRVTNFISAVRFIKVRYYEKPIESQYTRQLFADEYSYLASIGISTRKYMQDKYIFKFGVTEDVPVGKVISLTGGYQAKNKNGRYYLGARVSAGNYYPWGYLGFNLESGTFITASHAEQGVFSAGANYYTGLFEVGKWKFRQFVKPQLIIGINRFAPDSLTLNDGYGMDGFNSSSLSGNSRIILTMQTQSYAPWNFIGFRFGPFFTFSVGKLGDAETGFRYSKMYSQIGLGVLIKNDHLVINTFQISIAFYPVIPGIGQNIFKANSFRTVDIGLRDFEIGKPAVVVFQ
ncbi:MAG: hypothetical protein HGA37_09555 [Lentimicrobium sp.]|nr:hypothetical protein [Lentimicrobium sp.]